MLSRRSDPAQTLHDAAPPPARRWPVFPSLAGYAARNLNRDLAAGLTLAAIAIPEQMATARLGGFPPGIGFFAFIAGSVAFALFGVNRFLSAGADSTITPIFAGGLAVLAATGSPQYAGLAAALALAVGIMVTVGGLLRLGWIANLLSAPITTGFLAGIAVHIIVSQLPGLLGIAPPGGSLPHQIAAIAGNLGQANLYTVALGVAVFAVTQGSERISARVPGALIGLVAATVAVTQLHLEDRGVAVLGPVPSALPHLAIPAVTLADLVHILPLAVIVSLVIMVQTAATTRAFLSDPGQPPAVNHDFIGVGVGSLLAGLFGAFPVNASPPRTATVSETGGRSQIAGLTAAALVLGLVAFGAALLSHVPQAALAGVLMFIGLRIFRVREMIAVYRRTWGEFALIVATMAAIVALPIETGVGVGIVLSLLHGIWTTTRVRAIEMERVPGTSIWWPASPQQSGELLPGLLVIAFQAPLSFLNADDFRRDVLTAIARRAPRLVVLEAGSIIEIDYTAAKVLTDVIEHCRAAHIQFAVARLESVRAQDAFTRFGIMDLLQPGHLFHSVDEAVRALTLEQDQDDG